MKDLWKEILTLRDEIYELEKQVEKLNEFRATHDLSCNISKIRDGIEKKRAREEEFKAKYGKPYRT